VDAADATAERRRYLGIGKIVDVTERQGEALLRGQLGESGRQRPPCGENRVAVGILYCNRLGGFRKERQWRFTTTGPTTPLQSPQRVTHGDPMYPSIEGLWVTQPVQRAQNVDRHILGNVAGLLAAFQQGRTGA